MRLKAGTIRGADVKKIDVKDNGITELMLRDGAQVRISPAVSNMMVRALKNSMPGAMDATVIYNKKLRQHGVVQAVGVNSIRCFVAESHGEMYRICNWSQADCIEVKGRWNLPSK